MRARHAVSLLWVFGLVAGDGWLSPRRPRSVGSVAATSRSENGERANVRPARAAAAGSCPPGRVDHP
jgi:hypothetical protein